MVAAAFQKPMEAKPEQLWLRIHSIALRIGKHQLLHLSQAECAECREAKGDKGGL